MPTRYFRYPFKAGEYLQLKKKHPCGGDVWRIERVGADIGMKCLTCGRFQAIPRSRLETMIRMIQPPETAD
ncbi:MAG: DUF951 domain-containing protein [Clostridia bacterium]|nr:DUF951 domain-containing protein [Eubacteriales bacterium]MDD4462481.1 DUF951 domain-containing protein [Eubacteriales bacterium]NCC48542.1 DUF951 domain-containing protein [Clostridia bacterium]